MRVEINQLHYTVWTLPLEARLFKARCGRRRRAAYCARNPFGKIERGEADSLRQAIADAQSITQTVRGNAMLLDA